MKWATKEWRDAIATLRVLCGTKYPVSVRRVPMPVGDYGDATRRNRRYHVRITKSADIHHALLVLTHEWAHCMTWDSCTERDPHHNPEFGIAWAKAYRAVFYNNQ